MSRELELQLERQLDRLRHLVQHPLAANAALLVGGLVCVVTDLPRHTGIPTIVAILILYVKAKQRTASSSRPPSH